MAISIPYGAIKSYLSQIRRFGQNNISIPYGAIKSVFEDGGSEIQSFISIPYGAIKSVKPKTIRIKVFLFQFLMVRLKESINLSINLLIISFQFLMVRLKDKRVCCCCYISVISIPYGAIKRAIIACFYG